MATFEKLSERENQVLHEVAQGFSNRQIAQRLNISEHTVEKHLTNIYLKLGVSSRSEAMRLYFLYERDRAA